MRTCNYDASGIPAMLSKDFGAVVLQEYRVRQRLPTPQYRRNIPVGYSIGASIFFTPARGGAGRGAAGAGSTGTAVNSLADNLIERMTTELSVLRYRRLGRTAGMLLLAAGSFGFGIVQAGSSLAQDTGKPTRIDRSGADERPERQPTVRVEELGAPGAGSSGTLGDRSGGLGAGLWRGASLEEAVALIDRLPAANRSPLLHALQRRLLLTVALAPAGKPQAAFVRARLKALIRMGAVRETVELAARTQAGAAPPFPAIRARFLAGDSKGACAAVAAVPGAMAPFIEQARIACHVLNGHTERAEIALRLLHEQGAPPPRHFERAVAAVTAGKWLAQPVEPVALTLPMLSSRKIGVKSANLDSLSTGALLVLSDNPKIRRTLRIRALEHALARGAPVDRKLARLYAGVRASPKKIADAPATRLRDFNARSRAHLYLAAAAAGDRPRRVRILAAWWRLAAGAALQGDDGAEMLAAQMTVPFLGKIDPSPAYQDHAAHIARAYFATGRTQEAFAWYRFLKAAPFRNPADLHRITVPAMLAASTTRETPETVKSWIGFKRWRKGDSAAAHLADLKALFDGLGRADDIPRPWRSESAEERKAARKARPERDAALLEAAADGRRGLTVLRILTLVKGRSLRRVPRSLLRDAVFGLRTVGLDREARQLAVEAALARQL